MTESKEHGGRRQGAGRPRLFADEDVTQTTVTLPAASLAKLREIGNGSISAGIQKLLDRLREIT